MCVYVSEPVDCETTIDWPWKSFHILVMSGLDEYRRFMGTFKYHGAIFRRFGMTISTMIPPCLYELALQEGAELKDMVDIEAIFKEGMMQVPNPPA